MEKREDSAVDFEAHFEQVELQISKLQGQLLKEKSIDSAYEELRRALKTMIERVFAKHNIQFLLRKDFFKLILNTYNLMVDVRPESQLHALELVSLIIGRANIWKSVAVIDMCGRGL